MSHLSCAVLFVVWAIGQTINGDYGFAILNFLFAGLDIFFYLIDRNEEVKKAFKKFEEIFFEVYGKDEKKMTADKIIKANAYCGSLTPKCNDCPYYLAKNDNNDDCIAIMRKDAVKLINYLGELAEVYKNSRDEYQNITVHFAKLVDKLKEENTQLQKELQQYQIKEILCQNSEGAGLAKLALDILERKCE